MRTIGLAAALGLLAGASCAIADVLSAELNEASPTFAGFRYQAFRFEGLIADDAIIAARSADLDSYLLLVDPFGRVLTNDDHAIALSALEGHDAGLLLDPGRAGRWTAIVTTSSAGETGSFDLHAEGLPPVSAVADLDHGTLISAFRARLGADRSGPTRGLGDGSAQSASADDATADAATDAASSSPAHMPELLPWPPPDASARAPISRRLFGDEVPETLGGVADALADALAASGYGSLGYLGVPSGFAVITRIEQTDRNGRPLDGAARWSVDIAEIRSFSIAGYLRALLTSEPGYFRVLVLIVTDHPFATSGDRGRLETLERWSGQGLDALPYPVRGLAFSDAHRITGLVYEFEKATDDADPEVRLPGRNEVLSHLAHTPFAGFLR